MKKLTMMMLGLVIFQNANANVACSTITRANGIGQVRYGVRVQIADLKKSKSVWFGTSPHHRLVALSACAEIVSKTNCQMIEPKPEDQYMNVGDVGFGPMQLVQRSSKAGILHLMPVKSSVAQHLSEDYSDQHHRYFAFYEQCVEKRAELAFEAMDHIREQQEAARRQQILNGQNTSVQMCEKL